MNNSNSLVVIKGNKNGIVVILDDKIPFEELKQVLIEKFENASNFFKEAKMAVSFEGRELSLEEEKEIIRIIETHSKLQIVCVVDNNKMHEEVFQKSIDEKLNEISSHTGQFYKGTLRSGQVFECDTSVIILGDVNPGAKVVSKGNVIVLGTLKGNIFAGATGNESCFVVALDMCPMQIRIGDVIARCSDSASKEKGIQIPKIAYIENGNICIETLDKSVLSGVKL